MNSVDSHTSLIVLTEDNPRDVTLVKLALAEHAVRYTLLTIEDGQTALQYIDGLQTGTNESIPDLLMLDLNLPKVSGQEILFRIRQGLNTSQLPVLILSSSDSIEDRDSASAQGADYFQKVPDLEGFMKVGELVKSILASALCSTEAKRSSGHVAGV